MVAVHLVCIDACLVATYTEDLFSSRWSRLGKRRGNSKIVCSQRPSDSGCNEDPHRIDGRGRGEPWCPTILSPSLWPLISRNSRDWFLIWRKHPFINGLWTEPIGIRVHQTLVEKITCFPLMRWIKGGTMHFQGVKISRNGENRIWRGRGGGFTRCFFPYMKSFRRDGTTRDGSMTDIRVGGKK